MKRKVLQILVPLLLFFLAACGSSGSNPNDRTVEKQAVIDLLCGPVDQAVCVSTVCADVEACPLLSALSSQAVFNFVQTYSQCQGCNTPELPIQSGIGKCIEYRISEISTGWAVMFSVSDNCSFRYGSPGRSWIIVEINADGTQIENIQPPVAYIQDPSYCQSAADCYCLSGSGVPFIGCSNKLYAPLNWSGYYAGNECGCELGQCLQQ